MTVQELIDSGIFAVEHVGGNTARNISKPFCCDLLSVAMSRAAESCAWVTVMGNMNTLAVTTLTEAACVILAEGAVLDEMAQKKAVQEEITVLSTQEPIFEAALKIWKELQKEGDEWN